jgi:hypothetical protein
MMKPTDIYASDLWAITSYFNPIGFRRRLSNFRIFRENLQIPLIVVELAYGPEFELQATDAEILIQLRGESVLWQKERLLNVALQSLPSHCRKVAWLDCDILFSEPDWADTARSLLDRFEIIQLFRQVHNLGPDWTNTKDTASQTEFTQPSVVAYIASGTPAATHLASLYGGRKKSSALGYAWAARRELMERHHFFDSNILGGGDRALICALYGCFNEVMLRHHMNARQRQRYLEWAEPFYAALQTEVGFLDADISHLWHGEFRNRKGLTRHQTFSHFQFDPYADVAIAENGSWRWNSEKPDLHEYVRNYFAERMEDG